MSPAVFSIRIRIRFSGIYGMMGAGMQVPEQTAEKITDEKGV
jgi:hypothetical protein